MSGLRLILRVSISLRVGCCLSSCAGLASLSPVLMLCNELSRLRYLPSVLSALLDLLWIRLGSRCPRVEIAASSFNGRKLDSPPSRYPVYGFGGELIVESYRLL